MSSLLGWDAAALRAPPLPWAPLHHSLIKQEPLEAPPGSGFLSSHSEGFHSASPSSSSRDSAPPSPSSEDAASPGRPQPAPGFRPLTPPFGCSPAAPSRRAAPQLSAVTPPKSPSPPPWASEGAPSPGCDDDEPGLRVPAVNSHGKVKTFKCKQCEFVAVTKLDFWDHTKSHIKPERMLNCPKCPFVTEYKHHLEYHMRNHFGSKPFQCTQCSYSCVNKSMLNSHLKSHSNIYQYRCADCNYATKYCHSLKLHLRKYQHQPAMVLNQDGTPNPLPIIDVYGTRRGPKQRPQAKEDTSPTGLNLPQSHSLFQNPFGMNFPYGSLFQNSMLFPHNNNLNESPVISKPLDDSTSLLKEDDQTNGMRNISPLLMQPRFMSEYGRTSPKFGPVRTNSPDRLSNRMSPYSPRLSAHTSPHVSPREEPSDALDLTNASKSDAPPSTPLTPTATLKSRRKGRAFKLERPAARVQQADEEPAEIPLTIAAQVEQMEIKLDVQTNFYEAVKDKYENEKVSKEHVRSALAPPKPSKESYDCQYCDIVFKDIIMYTMHMGYHGFQDPFTCNMCGHRSTDKVAFFVHIARAQHS